MKFARQPDKNVLLFDIENAPILMYSWQTREATALKIERDWYMLCWSAKWLGVDTDESLLFDALPLHKAKYARSKSDDSGIVKSLRDLLDAADVVVGHNLDRFDVRKFKARCIYHGIKPPSPFRTIDTLKEARKQFHFTSNTLKYLAEYLGCDLKGQTGGIDLWFDCMRGDADAWERMVQYNRQDIRTNEEVFFKLFPYMTSVPALFHREPEDCQKCGADALVEWKTVWSKDGVSAYVGWECENCGSHFRSASAINDREDRMTMTRNYR